MVRMKSAVDTVLESSSDAFPTVQVMDCRIHNLDLDEAAACMLAEAESPEPSFAVTPNVDHLIMMRSNALFRAAYNRARYVVADGMPLLWAARLMGTPLKQRVCGSDLIDPICAGANQRGLSIFLLGGRPGTAAKAAERLTQKHAGLRIAGTYCPPFGFHTDQDLNGAAIQAVREVRPDILFVGLGAPKQEVWLSEHLDELGVPFSIGIGAGIDFTAGEVSRAPRLFRDSGFEWLYRIMADRRLAKRYLWRDLPFIAYLGGLAIRKMFRGVGRLTRLRA